MKDVRSDHGFERMMDCDEMLTTNRPLPGKEHRQSERRPGNFNASILVDGRPAIRCLVKDFSKTGALLLVPSILGVPDQFDLQAPSGQRRRVEVKWRGRARIGVKFI